MNNDSSPTMPLETVSPAKRFLKGLLDWLKDLVIAIVAVTLVTQLLVQPVRVDGESMQYTLRNGELMLVTKPEYLLGDPAFGDVVVCRYPGRGRTLFVKRVMGLPGDTIEIRNNVVYRNGEAVQEPYLTPELNDNGFSMQPVHLGEEEYFVMGDNRDNSHDSRNYFSNGEPCAIHRDLIRGHVRWIAFPFTSIRTVQ